MTPPRGVLARFDLSRPDGGPFPSDVFTVLDTNQNTGRRVNMPYPDCSVQLSDCHDLNVINTLDGFGLQTRLSIPFDSRIDPTSVNSQNVFLIALESYLPGANPRGDATARSAAQDQFGIAAKISWTALIHRRTHVTTIDSAVRLARRVSSSKLIAAAVLAVLLTQIAGIAQINAPVFPDLIPLPADFGSEGIAVGIGDTFYVGSFTLPSLGQILPVVRPTSAFARVIPPDPARCGTSRASEQQVLRE